MRTEQTTEPFLSLSNVSKRFGGTHALRPLDWSVMPGEVHCLCGENGSGKSTLIKIIAGVHQPEAGSLISIDGGAPERLTPNRAKALGIQVIYQDLSLFPNLTVLENIAIDLELDGMFGIARKRRMRQAAKEAIARIDANLSLEAAVSSLNVAQRQLVAICRGLAVNARLLFMDEPTASLTRHEVGMLLKVVERLKSMGVAVVFVSHRLEEVAEIADRITVLRDGSHIGTYPAAEVDHDRLVELMTGNRISHEITAVPTTGRQEVLSVRGLSRHGEFRDVSFDLHKGEILGITGLLGSGRTELALALFGMNRAEAGEVLIEGSPVRLRSNQDAIKAGIAYLSEDRLGLGLNLRQSIRDNIAVSVLDRMKGSGLTVTSKSIRELAARWIGSLDIKTKNPEAAVTTLSGGNQQRVVLAKWLATNPKILILDSPTVGVDIKNKQGMYQAIRDLAREGMSIIMISDEISEVYFNCDRVLHMREGRIADSFVPGDASEQSIVEAVYA
jgi:simple sugar transport system ATP-binding protein